MMASDKSPLVSVVIPCYNQAHFLAEAIESVLAQSYRQFEIVVIDDGSTDGTAQAAASYSNVRYFRQDNQGLAAARNSGLRLSRGDYVVFLDADDRLLPNALKCGLVYLNRYLDCAFVVGHYRRVAADGTVLPTWREQRIGSSHCFISGDFKLIGADGSILETWKRQRIASDHYAALLQRNHISMHAAVMYRRKPLETIGGFDPALPACEDYDVYLRLARQYPIACHNHVVADYRQHSTNMTRNSSMMLNAALTALHSQWEYVQGNTVYEQAYKHGEKSWRDFYFMQALGETRVHLQTLAWVKACRAARMPVQHILRRVKEAMVKRGGMAWYRLKTGWGRFTRLSPGQVKFGDLRRVKASGSGSHSHYTSNHSVERYYLERFLEDYVDDVCGHTLVVGNVPSSLPAKRPANRRAGSGRLSITDRGQLTMGSPDIAVRADLSSLDDIPAGSYDCIILVQALHRVYDIRTALQAVYHLLRPGGVLLATAPGFSRNKWADSSYWAFTDRLARQLFGEIFPASQLTIRAYGNVLAATALLHHLPAGELRQEALDFHDPQYQLLVAARAIKPRGASNIQ